MDFEKTLEEIMAESAKRRKRRERRRTIVGAILGAAIGTVLSLSGYGVTTWQFWVIVALSLGHILNMGL